MRILFSGVCLLFALLLSGCGTPPERRLESPAMRFVELAPSSGGHVLTLRFINPNTAPLVVNRSTHIVVVGEQRLGRIEDPQPIGIPPLGTVTHSVALPAPLASSLRDTFAKNAGDTAITVETSLEVVVGPDNDTLTLRSAARGTVRGPSPSTVTIQ